MKSLLPILVLIPCVALSAQAQVASSWPSTPPAGSSAARVSQRPFVASERGPYHTRWVSAQPRTNSAGRVFFRTNSFIELGAGINRQVGNQWVASTPRIEPAPSGAVASGAGHQVRFSSDLNTQGAIQVTGPDGRIIRSQLVGLSYFDTSTGSNVLIAVTKSCQGVILPSKKAAFYADALSGVKADVTYRYSASGADQDVTIRQQLPAPEEWGLISQSTELQIITEYLDIPTSVRAAADDDAIEFGAMHFAPGRAFALQPTAGQTPVTLKVRRHSQPEQAAGLAAKGQGTSHAAVSSAPRSRRTQCTHAAGQNQRKRGGLRVRLGSHTDRRRQRRFLHLPEWQHVSAERPLHRHQCHV